MLNVSIIGIDRLIIDCFFLIFSKNVYLLFIIFIIDNINIIRYVNNNEVLSLNCKIVVILFNILNI